MLSISMVIARSLDFYTAAICTYVEYLGRWSLPAAVIDETVSFIDFPNCSILEHIEP